MRGKWRQKAANITRSIPVLRACRHRDRPVVHQNLLDIFTGGIKLHW
jgi:hypothetical protein